MNNLLKEMVAGCCVCSDERGWAENPLVYCDGAGCNIAVHQACYGIKSVPDGNWYCRKCESQERSARVRCELCPSKDGALKRTDNGSWAHVVCGLYIPEVWFGDVAIMEPIVLSQIPTERYNKVCYICEQNNRGSRASVGACMQCNKAGCKQQFHVTCAQAMGLLCEEAGNYSDNVKYCGYCQEHFMKLKKGSNVKTIPPYRPLSFNNSGSEDSPEKKPSLNYNQTPGDLKQAPKRKSVSSRPPNQNGPARSSTGDRKESSTNQPNVDHHNGTVNANTCTTNSQTTKNDNSSRFTTSNFVESVITPSESIFADMQKKRRKMNEQPSPVNVNNPEHDNSSKLSANQNDDNDDDDDGEDATLNIVEEPNLSTLKQEATKTSISFSSSAGSSNVTTVISSSAASASAPNVNVVLPVTSVNVSQSNTLMNPVSTSYLSASTFSEAKNTKNENQQPDKSRSKSKRQSGAGSGAAKKGSKGGSEKDSSVNGPVDPFASPYAENNSPAGSFLERSNSMQLPGSVKSEKPDPATVITTTAKVLATSAAATTTSAPSASSNNQTESKESSVSSSPENSVDGKPIKNEDKGEKELKSFQSGSSAPHMLGNQLNPSSSMAQKMSDTLTDELEAHSIFTNADSNASASSFVGPPLYNKIISTTRASKSKRSNSPSNGPLASLSGSAANFPQSLEELLETQWEQGGTFLMEQAQHFDIASLLTCLHKLREENLGLEEHIRKLKARRDHLLGVNARLAMPLAPISQPVNNVHPPSQPQTQQAPPVSQTLSQTTHHPQMVHITQQQSQPQQPSPAVSHVSHPQQYQSSNQSQTQAGISEAGNLRNIPLPGGMFSSASATTLRGPHSSVYSHALENGLPPTPSHRQHSHAMSAQSNPGAIRHHSSGTNPSLYSGQSAGNQGVVVRAPNLIDVQRTDRRNASILSSNYQQSYQMSSISHQQQMAMQRDDSYHSVHAKQN